MAGAAAPEHDGSSGGAARKRVLIVDDDADIAEALSILLSSLYEVETASNGSEAAQLVCRSHFDAVVLDLMMPIMDAAGFKQELRSHHIDVPVLLMSATNNLPERAAEIGAEDFISKPLDLDRLERQLAALLLRAAQRGPSSSIAS